MKQKQFEVLKCYFILQEKKNKKDLTFRCLTFQEYMQKILVDAKENS